MTRQDDLDVLPMRRFVDRLVEDERVRGAGLAVALDGRQVLEHYAGQARTDLGAGPTTLWPLASITKLYTAAAIMRLIERGELSLGQQISTLIPAFSGGGKERITLRQLLTHTSGIPYESPAHAERLAQRVTMDEIVDEVYRLDLDYEPGTKQSYSDLGYALAGRFAAIAAGVSFEKLVRCEVIEPAGLGDTFLPCPPDQLQRVATVDGTTGYGTDTAMYNSAYALGLAHPAFGAVASLPELMQFALLFDPWSGSRMHSRIGLRIMTTDQTCGDDAGEETIAPAGVIHAWGIGFMVKGRSGSRELASPASYGHGGATGCNLWIDPEYRITIAFVSNVHYFANPVEFVQRSEQVVSVVMSTLTR